MRVVLLLIASVFTLSFSHAQPVNDNCSGAIELNLSALFPCPFATTSSNFFIYNNTNATPAYPYPSFFDCGADPNPAAAEVWFAFVPNGEKLTIRIEGLQTPNLVLFEGENCTNLIPFFCASSEPDSGYLDTLIILEPLQKYYMMIAGADPMDQGEFNIIVKNQRDCNACNLEDNFTANPPPVNGTYQAGDTVQFCYTINKWDISNIIEWPHSLEVFLGDGWDEHSFVPTPPPSCDGQGNWNWYNEWESCNTGQVFGPGFAYESAIGVNCGGTPMDDNPGNNWGDGSGACAGIGTTAPPLEFCWTVVVDECLGVDSQADLSIGLDLHSDGESGSWIQVGCNTLADFTFLSSAACIDTLPSFVEISQTSCPGNCDGSFRFVGSGNGPWDYTVLDQDSLLLLEILGTSDTLSLSDLCAGVYTINFTDLDNGSNQSIILQIEEGPQPIAIAQNTGPACPEVAIELLGSTTDTSGTALFYWTGPDGFESDEQNPGILPGAGSYVLEVTVDGCTSEPDTTFVEIAPLPEIVILPNDTIGACEGETITITADGILDFLWENALGDTLGKEASLDYLLNENETLFVYGSNESGCVDTAHVSLLVFPGPDITLSTDTSICLGGTALLEASGGLAYLWSTSDSTAQIAVSPTTTSTYIVTVTDANGCTSAGEVSVIINSDFSVDAGIDQDQCQGSFFAFNAIAQGGIPPYQFIWNDPDLTEGAFLFVNPDTSTSYVVTATDAMGCETMDTVIAGVTEPGFTLTATPPIICSGQKSTLSVEGGTVLEWSTGAISNSTDVTPDETTTYSVMVVSNNCLFTSEITVEVYPIPNLPDIQCIAEQETITFLWSSLPDSFNVVINTGQSGELTTEGLTVSDLEPQETVSITMEVFGDEDCIYTVESSCTTPACPGLDLQIQAVEDICLFAGAPSITLNGSVDGGNGTGVFLWSGPGVSAAGTFNPFEAGPGTHTIILNYFEDNCSTSTSIDVNVEAPLSPPIINCSNTDIAVEFSWDEVPGATAYQVLVVSGHEGTQIGNVFTVVDLTPGDIVTIEVIAVGDGICGNSSAEASCVALSCTALAMEIVDNTTVCHSDEPFTIPVNISNGLGDGSFQWFGNCVVNPETGLINPQSCAVGTHAIFVVYTEGDCSVTAETTITILPPASAQFAATPNICFGQMATAIFTGPLGSGYTYHWDFDGGQANTGVGPGPHVISWDTPGEKTISLSIESNGCTAGPYNQTILVHEALSPLPITCEPGPGTATFQGVPDPAIEPVSYSVAINGDVIPPPFVVDNQILIEGLTPGDTVVLTLLLFDPGPCDNVSATYSCIVEDCPDVTIAVEQVPEICLEGNLQPFILDSEVVGVNLDGVLRWSGPGIVDSISGLFDPFLAGVGDHSISLSYTDDPCFYSTSIAMSIVAPLVISNVNINCNDEGSHYYLSFDVLAADTSYIVMSDSILSGAPLVASFAIEESCQPLEFDLVKSCDCTNTAGTMATTLQCGLGTVSAQFLGGADLNVMDLLQFYLHDNSGNVLGQVLAKRNFPSFNFNPNHMEYGQVYYVSAVVGPNNGFGQIDLNDPCLAVSIGQPVVFSEKPGLIGPDEYTICAGQSITFGLDLPVDATISWAPSLGLSCIDCTQPTANPGVTTTYSASITDTFGCESTIDVTVFVDEFPTGSIPDDPVTACPGKPFEFCLPEALSYSWTGPNNFQLSNQCLFMPTYLPGMAGTYTAEVTLSDGCVLTESIEVITDDPLVVNSITPDTSVCRFSFFTLRADVEGADHYVWFPASNVTCQTCQTTQAFINNTTVFTLVAIAESGCQITRQITVTRQENCGGLGIFMTSGLEEVEDFSATLFPNPTNQELNISIEAANLIQVEVYTLEGKLLQSIPAEGQHQIIDVGHFPKGTYLVRIRSDQGVETKKFVVME